MNSFEKLLELLHHNLIKLSKKSKIILYKINEYISFILNKRKTIEKMYEPIVLSKEKENKEISLSIKEIKNKTNSIEKDINNLNSHILDLKNSIEYVKKDLIN